MKTICFYFVIHQPNHLKRYRFFDIGTDHYYYDDYENERQTTEAAQNSYLPALRAMLDMIHQHGKDFRVAFSISGVFLEQLEIYADDVECSHGCTSGYLAPDELFYLRSRGIPEDEARRLQKIAFLSPVLKRVPAELAEEIYDSIS